MEQLRQIIVSIFSDLNVNVERKDFIIDKDTTTEGSGFSYHDIFRKPFNTVKS